MMKTWCIVTLLFATAVFSQQVKPSEQQIEEGKKLIAEDPAKARKKIKDNQEMFNSLPPEQQEEVLRYIQSSETSRKKNRSEKAVAPIDSSSSDSLLRLNGAKIQRTGLASIDTLADTLSDTLALDTLNLDTTDTMKMAKDTIIFGRELFLQDYSIPISTEIPDGYVITPGDEILLRFWGRYNQEQKYLIGQDGYVFVEPLNRQLFLPGMTYGELRAMIQRVSQSSPGVQGDVKLVNAHPIFVNIAGYARQPGTVSFPATYSFWQVLMSSKGPSGSGSVRDIRVTRKGKEISRIDMYDFLENGKEPVVALKNEDLIFFGKLHNVVTIDSMVRNPGMYEMKQSEHLGDLVDIAGGFSSSAFSPTILIDRAADFREKATGKYPRIVVSVDLTRNGWEKTELRDGDTIKIKNMIARAANEVYVSGPGFRVQGTFSLPPSGMTLDKLIEETGGLVPGTHSSAELLRLKPDGTRYSIPVNFSRNESMKLQLVAFDSLLTFNDSQFVELTTVKSHGFIRKEIDEPYSDSLTLMDVIRRSDGTGSGALPYVYVKQTDDLGNITYEKFNINDTAAAQSVIMRKRDEVFFFDYRDFHEKIPVTVLAFDREPLVLDYSPDLTFQIIIHELNGLNPLVDSNRIEICEPDYHDEKQYVLLQTYSLDSETIDKKGIVKEGSIVFLRKDPKKISGKYVFFEGEILRPGRYALLRTDYHLSELFTLSGGITERGNKYAISILREGKKEPIPVEIVENSDDTLQFRNDWVLNQNDRIFVGRNDYSVEVAGEVFDPRTIAFNPDYGWSDYIKKGAGGFTDSAKVSNTFIQYPNGMSKKARPSIFSGSPKVVPGSKIIVPRKPSKPPKQPGEGFDYAKAITMISSSLMTVLSLLVIAQKL